LLFGEYLRKGKDASAAATTTTDVAAKRANKHLPKTTRIPGPKRTSTCEMPYL